MTNDEVFLKRLEEMVVLASDGRLGDMQRMTVLGIPERFKELMALASRPCFNCGLLPQLPQGESK